LLGFGEFSMIRSVKEAVLECSCCEMKVE